MKKSVYIFTLLALVLASAFSSMAKKSENKSSETTLAAMLDELDYTSPKRSGIESLDKMYDSSDQLYASLVVLRDSLPVYSLRSIVNDGDTTAILVVDQNGKPYNSFSAASQIVNGTLMITTVTANGASLALQYASVAASVPSIVKDHIKNPLAIPGIVKTATNHSKKVGKIAKNILPAFKDLYERRGNPIKQLAEVSKGMSKEDGFVTSGFSDIPEFSPEQMPSDEELDMLLEQERAGRE